MPSTLVSSHDNSCYPRLPRMKDFGCGFEEYRQSPNDSYKAQAGHTPLQPDQKDHKLSHSYDNRVPHVMSTYSTNGPQVGGWQGRSADVLTPNPLPYPTPQDENNGHSRNNSRSEPFYTKYYSARKPASPVVKKEVEQKEPVASQRRPSAEESSIAAHLQIPSSINDSRGSLPEFAAQVRFILQRSQIIILTVNRSLVCFGLNPHTRCSPSNNGE